MMNSAVPDIKPPRQESHAAVRHLYISSGHNFFGRHGRPAGKNPLTETGEIECVAGRGIRGDRFFDYRENYKGQITFFAFEIYAALCDALSTFDKTPSVFRRNVITEGLELNALIGEEFAIQGVHFRGTEECKPCYWMSEVFAPGAEEFLRGRGGLRAVILSDGKLSAETVQRGLFTGCISSIIERAFCAPCSKDNSNICRAQADGGKSVPTRFSFSKCFKHRTNQ